VRDAMLDVLDDQGLRDGGLVHEMVLRQMASSAQDGEALWRG